MHYKKYEVRSQLFALRDPRLSAQVLAAFSGATLQAPRPASAATPARRRPLTNEIRRPRDRRAAAGRRAESRSGERRARHRGGAQAGLEPRLARVARRAPVARAPASAFPRRCSRWSSCRCSTRASTWSRRCRRWRRRRATASARRCSPACSRRSAAASRSRRRWRRFPQHFSPLYVATVKASERTGSMREALGRYIAYQEELERVRKKIVSASIYPVILMVVGTLVHRLSHVLRGAALRARVRGHGEQRCRSSRALLLGFGNFVGNNALVIGSWWHSFLYLRRLWAFSQARFRGWLNARLWRIPALGERMKVYQLARLYRTAGMLLRRRHPGGARARHGARPARGAPAAEPHARQDPDRAGPADVGRASARPGSPRRWRPA